MGAISWSLCLSNQPVFGPLTMHSNISTTLPKVAFNNPPAVSPIRAATSWSEKMRKATVYGSGWVYMTFKEILKEHEKNGGKKSFCKLKLWQKSQLSRLGLMNRIKEAFIDLNTSSPHQRQRVRNWKQKAQNQNHIKITCNVSRFLSLVMHRFGTQQHPGCLFTIPHSRMCVSHISVFSFKRLPKTSTNQSAVFWATILLWSTSNFIHKNFVPQPFFLVFSFSISPSFDPPFSAPQNYQTTKPQTHPPLWICQSARPEGWWPESWKWRPEGSGGPSTPWNL